MGAPAADGQTLPRPLRLWPGVISVALGWLIMLVLPLVAPGVGMFSIFAGIAGGIAVVIWWLFFSRAPWFERVGAIVVMVAATFAVSRLAHVSLQAGGGLLIVFYAIPVVAFALVASTVASRRLATGPRRAAILGAILLACGALALLRIDGVNGRAAPDFAWRWSPTVEEKLVAGAAGKPAQISSVSSAPISSASASSTSASSAPASAAPAADVVPATVPSDAQWPGFRGPRRDGIVSGVRIETDWSQSPPVELWRRPIGPGWSSFAVDGDRFYTQEQLGEDEIVSCYDLRTGEPVWRHRDQARFWEAVGGAGPRGTPTLDHGRVYTFGATGILNALDAGDGSVLWSRASDRGRKPQWGFSSSPVVIGDLVVVAATGTLAAYDAATGEPRWIGPEGKCCYSSPHLATIDGVPQILLMNGTGVTSVAPADGTVLWEHEYAGAGIVQPAVTENGDLLISGQGMGAATGLRRLAVARASGEWSAERGLAGWTVEERWTSNGLKPFFSDFVIHEGHAYGFDGSILSCIGLEDGKRKWKGGRYGDGQLLLLADQDLLLVLSEKGELALVDATPGQFTERARHPAIEGKTWNHPALAGDVMLVRNSEEMAAYRLSLASR